jgi:hypothetical protein
MHASAAAWPKMPDRAMPAFLTEPVAHGATVVVLGPALPGLVTTFSSAVGPTGLVVVLSREPPRATDGAAAVRAVPVSAPLLSHVADVVIVPSIDAAGNSDALAEETRRLLAPRGIVRAWASAAEPGDTADRFAAALRQAAFRDVVVADAASGDGRGVRARGPR